MTTLSLAEAQARLPEIVHGLSPGEEIVITENSRPIARVVAEPALQRQPRKPGSAKGILTIVQEDDDHLKDFEEYMP
jgi:antitoxin (DNA-binding transcriptional repressor) of toxin-antitoxin stability system